jgi:hypothetical protein
VTEADARSCDERKRKRLRCGGLVGSIGFWRQIGRRWHWIGHFEIAAVPQSYLGSRENGFGLQQLQQRGCKNAQISTSHLFYVHLLLLLRSGGDNKRRDFKPVLLVGEILPGGKRVPLHLLLSLHRSCLYKRLCKQERRVHPPTLVHFALQRRFYRKCPQQIYHFEKFNFVEARFSCLWCTSGFAVW